MITIDTYTGNWQEALQPHHREAPRVGSMVRIAKEADARE